MSPDEQAIIERWHREDTYIDRLWNALTGEEETS